MTASAPLAGLRVVELSSFVASPLGGMTLARLGADVIRVDPVGGGPDRNRWPVAPGGESLYWAGLNQGKRSLTVDLRSPEGRALVAELVVGGGAGGGVVLTNARPRPGLSYEDLRARRPDVIYARLLGRRDGSTAVDYTVNAACGFPMLTGPEGTEDPVNHVLPAWDVATGLYLAIGLLAAERARARTGEGQRLEVALGDVALATAGQLGHLAEAQLSPKPRGRLGNQIYGDFGRDFATADGVRVMVVVLTARHWRDLVRVTGIGDALGEPAVAGLDAGGERYAHRETLTQLLGPWFAARDYDEVAATLGATSVLWSRYHTFSELAQDGALAENPLMGKVSQPGIGSYLAPGSPLVFDGEQI
ncbi:2-methylfumaryl-CoA isomerase, partial [Amycolatopsis rhizosphaerae]